ncbi:MAG: hypothetical protein JJ891_12890 [Rhizobiaceae bacterium]|nr:hypothetical protein [Rhizobiaceae bacterium]
MASWERLLNRIDPRPKLNFLHIGKNAGTQIRHFSSSYNMLRERKYRIIHRNHDIMLKRIPHDQDYFFSIRDPASRFRSGFYSRKRKGMPKGYAEWTQHEEYAFQEFESANDLAEALFLRNERGMLANAAIQSIRHTAMSQSMWFYNCGNLFRVRPPFAILRVENFEEDFENFFDQLGTKTRIDLRSDEKSSHRNNYSGTPELSELSQMNLRRWYCQDYEFLKQCENWLVFTKGLSPCRAYANF